MDHLQKEFWERKSLRERRGPDHPAVRAFALPKIKELLKFIKSNKNISLLDVGCGNGFFTKPFSKIFSTKGVDFSEKMISMNPIKGCEVQDADDLREKESSFDIVFCSNLLHHLENPKKAVKGMRRVSRKYVVLSEPNRNNPLMFFFSILKKEERGALKFSLTYLENLCDSNNLKIIHSRTLGAVVPNKTPVWLVPVLRLFDNIPFLGFYIFIISEKKS